MQPFDLTQCAYALETLMPGLAEEDVRRQRLANLLALTDPGTEIAISTALDACRLHVALQNVAALADFLARAAVYQGEIVTLLLHLERGDCIRMVVTENSGGIVTDPAPCAAVDALDPTARVA